MTLRSDEERDGARQGLLDLFADGSVHTTSVKGELELSKTCERPCCKAAPVHRIRLNAWGYAAEHDLCEEHSKLPDGRTRDGTRCDGP